MEEFDIFGEFQKPFNFQYIQVLLIPKSKQFILWLTTVQKAE